MAKHTTHKDNRHYLTKGNMRRRRNRERAALIKAATPARTAWAGVTR